MIWRVLLTPAFGIMASTVINADTGSSLTSAAATGALAVVEEGQPKSEQEILNTYRRMQSEMQSLIQNLTKFEMDRNEHRLVEETLEPLDPDRRAFRLVGGVLVERTVKEVLPTVKEHRNNVRKSYLSRLFIVHYLVLLLLNMFCRQHFGSK